MNSSYGLILYIAAFLLCQTCAQTITDNIIDDKDIHTNNIEEDEQIYSERNHITDPKEYLDGKTYELFSLLPALIDSAKLEIEEKLRFTLLKKNTQGWSIVYAGLADIFGDYVNNDYIISTNTQVYTYGFLFFYGLGFGFPALVGNPDLPPIDCSSENFQALVDRYGLSYGPINLASQFGVKSARSLVNEFDTFARLELACILDEEDNCESAAEVKWTLDNLIAAWHSRLDLV
jgi:hypothetical protein